MTVRELLTYIESVKPHVFPDSALLLWLNELEGRVQLDIFLMAPEETVEYTLPDDNETVLLVDLPHTGIYRYWLEAMIDFESGEYNQYQNDMELFNNAWNEFACWFAETQGTEGDGVSRGFYLSAYGIAVKHGYTGSEEEWLETLKGAPGEDFKYEDFTEEQLAALREGVVQDTLDQARDHAQAAGESARAAEDALNQMGDDAAAAEASAAAAKKSEAAAGESAEEAATSAKAAQDAQTGAEKAKYAVENLEVDAVSVPSGMPAYAQKSVNTEKEVLAIRFGIPKGVSPTVEVTEYEETENWGDINIIRSGHDVAITDEKGTKTFRVPNGRNGTDGKDGSVWVPYMNNEGNLSWENRAESDFYPAPAPVDIVQMVLDAMPEDSGGETIPGPGGSVDFDTSGLLDKATYDPQGKAQDVFAYADEKAPMIAMAARDGNLLTVTNSSYDEILDAARAERTVVLIVDATLVLHLNRVMEGDVLLFTGLLESTSYVAVIYPDSAAGEIHEFTLLETSHNTSSAAHEDIREIANEALGKIFTAVYEETGYDEILEAVSGDKIVRCNVYGELFEFDSTGFCGDTGDVPCINFRKIRPHQIDNARVTPNGWESFVTDFEPAGGEAITPESIGAIPSPASAAGGQTIVVKAVDANGKPTEWEAADLPSGGGGDGWESLGSFITAGDVYSISAYASGVITIDPINGRYPPSYPTNGYVNLVLRSKTFSTGFPVRLVETDVAGQYKMLNLDNGNYAPTDDLTAFVIDYCPDTILFENVEGYRYYKMRVTAPFLAVHGGRSTIYSNYAPFHGIDGNGMDGNATRAANGAVCVEFESAPSGVDGYLIAKTSYWGAKNYGNNALNMAKLVADPGDVKSISCFHYNGIFNSNITVELWGRKA